MDEPFVLNVLHNGKEQDFMAQLHLLGYIHRFVVQVGDTDVWFERDEEGAYRAILPASGKEQAQRPPDIDLLKAIAAKIEEVLA